MNVITRGKVLMSMSGFSVLLLAAMFGVTADAGEPEFVLQNELCRYVVGRDGTNVYFGTPDGQHNVCEPGQPFMQVCIRGQTYPASHGARSSSQRIVSSSPGRASRSVCGARRSLTTWR